MVVVVVVMVVVVAVLVVEKVEGEVVEVVVVAVVVVVVAVAVVGVVLESGFFATVILKFWIRLRCDCVTSPTIAQEIQSRTTPTVGKARFHHKTAKTHNMCAKNFGNQSAKPQIGESGEGEVRGREVTRGDVLAR